MKTVHQPSGACVSWLSWLFYGAGGAWGLWNSLHEGNQTAVLVIAAIGLLTVPMIVLHEAGHFLAGLALGARVFEFSIGSGTPVWKLTIKGVDIVVRSSPVCGHVRHLPREDVTSWQHAVFVTAGPGANLAVAAGIFAARGIASWPAIESWGVGEMTIAANAWLVLLTLLPFRTQTASGTIMGSDGWQLWKLLTGVRPQDLVIHTLKTTSPCGLAALSERARRSRIAGTIAWSATLAISGAFFGLTLFALMSGKKHHSPQAIVPMIMLGALPVAAIVSLARTWCRNPVLALEPRVRHSLSPLVRWTRDYEAEAARIFGPMVRRFPEAVVLKTIRAPGDPNTLSELDKLLETQPGNPALHLCRHDPLVAAGRHADAATALSLAAVATGLSEEAKEFLEALRTARILACEPTPAKATEIMEKAAKITNAGQRMHLLHVTSATVSMEGITELMTDALKWARAANEIYPHDATVHLQLAAVCYELGRLGEATEWLTKAGAAKTRGLMRDLEAAFEDLIAKANGRPGSSEALAKRLKDMSLPPLIRRKIECALQVKP